MQRLPVVCLFLFLAVPSWALAHDIWLQTNTPLIRIGDAVHVDVLLGNHGNEHRDFKLAGKVDAHTGKLQVHGPSGKSWDIQDRLVDVGYTPKEGYLTAKFSAVEPGTYTIAHTSDKVVNHGKRVRAVRSAKCCFGVSLSLDKIVLPGDQFSRPLGHDLELVFDMDPVAYMGPGKPLAVQLLFKGKPLPNARISFIPRGTTLAEGFDETFERRTDSVGKATYTPDAANYYLLVVHHKLPEEKSADYDETHYTATLTVLVPDVCPCCE